MREPKHQPFEYDLTPETMRQGVPTTRAVAVWFWRFKRKERFKRHLLLAWWAIRSFGHFLLHGNLDTWTEEKPC